MSGCIRPLVPITSTGVESVRTRRDSISFSFVYLSREAKKERDREKEREGKFKRECGVETSGGELLLRWSLVDLCVCVCVLSKCHVTTTTTTITIITIITIITTETL